MIKNSVWKDPELTARLTELYMQEHPQLSHRIIAKKLNKEFGLNLTRNACIGRASRIKLPPRIVNPKSFAPLTRPQQVHYPIIREVRMAPKPPQPAVPLGPFEPLAPGMYGPPTPRGIKFKRLRMFRNCHYPYGGPKERAYRFCGAPSYGETNWCKAHYDIVHEHRPRRRA